MSTSTPDVEQFQVGGEPTAEQMELCQWAREVDRKAMSLVHDSLKQLVTLTTALLAGSAAMLGSIAADSGYKIAGTVLLLFSLGAALFGSFPLSRTFDANCPEEIQAARDGGISRRMWCLWVSAACLVLAFVVLLVGMLIMPLFKPEA